MSTARPVATPVDNMTGVEMGFVTSHAPQIFLRPTDEDPAELDMVYGALYHIATRIKDADLDALVLVGDDHLHNLFLNLLPAFTINTGATIQAAFSSTEVKCAAAPELSNELLEHLLADKFDPAFSQQVVLDHAFMIPLYIMQQVGFDTPVIPIIVNVYVPPQPSMERCFGLGRSIADWAVRSNRRVAVMGSGGMSHYPGTDRFESPDLESDRMILDYIAEGDFEALLALSTADLDRMGQGEILSWAVALGARGTGLNLTSSTYWDSGHCGYAVLEF